jgi:hypothetical protein
MTPSRPLGRTRMRTRPSSHGLSLPPPATSATWQPSANKVGDVFAAGVVLHTGPATVGPGDRLAAVPLCALWSA